MPFWLSTEFDTFWGRPAHAAVPPPQTSGNDVFYRNPYNVEENLFVNLSSPSSSQFADVSVLGSPEDAAKRLLSQTLEEFMSTRIGSRKEAEIVGFSQREAGGRLYYDVEVRGAARSCNRGNFD